jgi:hypothetical protein
MSPYSINDPKHWLDRAKEARALAEHMSDPGAKRTMLKNAYDYVSNSYFDCGQRPAARSSALWASRLPSDRKS